MSFYDQLQQRTETKRSELYTAGLIRKALDGEITIEEYVSFLCQAYQHVKHTVPLLMAMGARVPGNREWLRSKIAHYIEEELGHQEWVLNDIAVCGFDKELARIRPPAMATELMVAYAYHMIDRVNPLGFLGMVHVLEGTSTSIADAAASNIQSTLNLPNKAFSYLISHGALDVSHVEFFQNMVNRIEDEESQEIIIHSANRFYTLYRNVFLAAEEDASAMSQLINKADCSKVA